MDTPPPSEPVEETDLETLFMRALKSAKSDLLADRLEKVLLFLKVHAGSIDILPEYVRKELTNMVHSDNLHLLWVQIVQLHAAYPARSEYFAGTMFKAHRSWAHMVSGSAECLPLVRQAYLSILSASFCEIMDNGSLEEDAKGHWGRIASTIPAEAKRYIYKHITLNTQIAIATVKHLDSNLLLDAMSAYLSSLSGRSHGNIVPSQEDTATILGSLIRAGIDTWGVEVVFSRLTKNPSSDAVIGMIVKSFEGCRVELLEFVRLAARLWSSAASIRQGRAEMHSYLSTMLLAVIPGLSKSELMEISGERKDGMSILSYLSVGVSACLDAADGPLRNRAMKVAKCFSKIMGVELNYEEESSPAITDKSSIKSNEDKVDTRVSASVVEDLSSDDSDLEAYLIESDDEGDEDFGAEPAPDGDHGVSKYRTNYLKVCLTYLQSPESSEDRRSKHVAALNCIPIIVKRGPEDARDMCAPLMRELLRISNHFNIETFEAMRERAALGMYTTYPQFSVPILTWAVCNDGLAISSRLQAVAILVKGAYELSGVPEPGKEPEMRQSNSALASSTTIASDSSENWRDGGKTIIKRPKKLAAMKKKTTYFRNNFGLVVESVFPPVASIVSALLVEDTKTITAVKTEITLTDILRYQGDATSEPQATSSAAPSKRLIDLIDGIDLLLPSQCLLALACFTRCSVNAVCQRNIVVATLELAFALKSVPALQLRRAAAVSLHAVIESWFHLRKTSEDVAKSRQDRLLNGELNTLTPMSYITNLGGMLSNASIEAGGMDEDPANVRIMEALQWITQAVHTESDIGCKSVYMDILRVAVEGMSP